MPELAGCSSTTMLSIKGTHLDGFLSFTLDITSFNPLAHFLHDDISASSIDKRSSSSDRKAYGQYTEDIECWYFDKAHTQI
jgi:hypothetical protein